MKIMISHLLYGATVVSTTNYLAPLRVPAVFHMNAIN